MNRGAVRGSLKRTFTSREIGLDGEIEHFLRIAVRIAFDNIDAGERPYGAVVARAGEVIATGANRVAATGDATAHAELDAIRAASARLGGAPLDGCTVYASGQPCPMCLAAMNLAGIERVYFAHSNEDGRPFALTSEPLYAELAQPLDAQRMRPTHVPVRLERDLYETWSAGRAVGEDRLPDT